VFYLRSHWETYSERVVGCVFPGPRGSGARGLFSTFVGTVGRWDGRTRSQGKGGGLRVKDSVITKEKNEFLSLILVLYSVLFDFILLFGVIWVGDCSLL
jgi:hypothetical protein